MASEPARIMAASHGRAAPLSWPRRACKSGPRGVIVPVWWTPKTLLRELFSRCPSLVLHTPLSSVSGWSRWPRSGGTSLGGSATQMLAEDGGPSSNCAPSVAQRNLQIDRCRRMAAVRLERPRTGLSNGRRSSGCRGRTAAMQLPASSSGYASGDAMSWRRARRALPLRTDM